MDTTLQFAACVMKSCVSVSIVDDEMLENDESFDITLKRTPGLDNRIILDAVVGVVEIIDNDGRYEDYMYMVVHTCNSLFNK